MANDIFAIIAARLLSSEQSIDDLCPPKYVYEVASDRLLLFQLSLLSKYYRGTDWKGSKLESVHWHCYVLDCPNILGEAPIQVILALQGDEVSAFILGRTDQRLIACNRRLNNSADWHFVETLGNVAVGLFNQLVDHGLISIPLDCSSIHKDSNGELAGLLGLTTNPAHQLINEVLPSIYLRHNYSLKCFQVGKYDYWGLRRWRKDYVDTNKSSTFSLSSGDNIEIFSNSLLLHGRSKQLSSYARSTFQLVSTDAKVNETTRLSYRSSRVTSILFKNLSSERGASIFISMRSDRKRKLVDDPSLFVINLINRLLAYRPSYLSGTKLSVFIDTYSTPCDISSFPVKPSSLNREIALANFIRQKLISTNPECLPIIITGLSMIEKLELIQCTSPSYAGYLGSAFCMYFQFSAYDAPAFIIGHDHLIKNYLHSPADDSIDTSFILPDSRIPTFTSEDCILEARFEPFPFEFFSIDYNALNPRLERFAKTFWSHFQLTGNKY